MSSNVQITIIIQDGTASRYTRAFIPEEIVYIETFETKHEAMKKEAQIKQLTRKQKELLILQSQEKTTEFLNQHPYQFKGE